MSERKTSTYSMWSLFRNGRRAVMDMDGQDTYGHSYGLAYHLNRGRSEQLGRDRAERARRARRLVIQSLAFFLAGLALGWLVWGAP